MRGQRRIRGGGDVFQETLAANQPFDIGLSEKLGTMLTYKKEQDEIGRQRQAAFDKARSEFKQKMKTQYDSYVYEDNFDDTGIDDIDAAASKLQNGIKEIYEMNEFAFRNGFIDESQLMGRNGKVKAQVMQFQNLTQDINSFIAEAKENEEAGKGSVLNDLKTELLEKFSKNVKFSAGLDGMMVSTKDKDGNPMTIEMGRFKDMITASQGVDLQSDVDALIELGGFEESIIGGKKVTDYTIGEEKLGNALDISLGEKSDEQLLDMGFKLGVFKKEGDALTEGQEGIPLTEEAIFDFKATKEQKAKIKAALAKEVKDQMALKRKKEIYNDPLDAIRLRHNLDKGDKNELMDTLYQYAVDLSEGGDKALEAATQLAANNKAIKNVYRDESRGGTVIEMMTDEGPVDKFIPDIKSKDKYNSYGTATALMAAVLPDGEIGAADLAEKRYRKMNPDYKGVESTSKFGDVGDPEPLTSFEGTEEGTSLYDELISKGTGDIDELETFVETALIERYGVGPKGAKSEKTKEESIDIVGTIKDSRLIGTPGAGIGLLPNGIKYKTVDGDGFVLSVPGGRKFVFNEDEDPADVQVKMLEFVKEYKQKGFGSETAKPGAKLLD